MAKPFLIDEDAKLESELIATMLAGLKEWRPDLDYPESHSDMQGCVRAVLRMFKIERRPLPAPLRIKCHGCDGLGDLITKVEPGYRERKTCPVCKGKRHLEER